MSSHTERPGWRDLAPFVRMFRDARGWMLIGLLLTFTSLLAGLGLLGVSGAFLTATAIAGLTPATAIAFNFFHPAATIRFLAIARTASRWGERVVTHEATFRLLATIRVWLYRRIAPLSPAQLGRYHGGDLLTRLTRDVDALDNLYQRLLLPALAAFLVLFALAALVATQNLVLVWPVALLMLAGLMLFPWLAWQRGRGLAPSLVAQRAQLRNHLLDSVDGCEDFSLHAPAWEAQRGATLRTAARWIDDQVVLQRRGAQLRALTVLAVSLAAWGALGLGASLPETLTLSGPWIAAIVLLLLGTAEALQALPAAWLELPGTVAAAQRLRALSTSRPTRPSPNAAPPPPTAA
jgi:ATP-binding cassette, subfamily C, bacterial CydC